MCFSVCMLMCLSWCVSMFLCSLFICMCMFLCVICIYVRLWVYACPNIILLMSLSLFFSMIMGLYAKLSVFMIMFLCFCCFLYFKNLLQLISSSFRLERNCNRQWLDIVRRSDFNMKDVAILLKCCLKILSPNPFPWL